MHIDPNIQKISAEFEDVVLANYSNENKKINTSDHHNFVIVL